MCPSKPLLDDGDSMNLAFWKTAAQGEARDKDAELVRKLNKLKTLKSSPDSGMSIDISEVADFVRQERKRLRVLVTND